MFAGYNDILLIPAGATNIRVEETSPTNNYLGENSDIYLISLFIYNFIDQLSGIPVDIIIWMVTGELIFQGL